MTSANERVLNIPGKPADVVVDYRELFLSGRALLDVRAPVEFAKGAFPNAINLPLMSDDERHQVGICYKEKGQQKAIELGAQLVTPDLQAQRVQSWKDFVQANPEARLYCFRGGLRSRISQQWLADAGVQIPLVEGGYKALRTFLIEELQRLGQALSYTLIGGRTGNGKTLLIKRLGSTVDLEALANHRGSSFGSLPGPQPSNIDFENALSIELMRLEEANNQHVYLEDEARLIGRVCLPDSFREVMQAAPIYILECDLEQRITNCFDDYVTDLLARYQEDMGDADGFEAYAEFHRGSLGRIQKRFGGENYKRALMLLNEALQAHREQANTELYRPFIQLLLTDYYDPMYDYQLSNKTSRIKFKGRADDIVQLSLSETAVP